MSRGELCGRDAADRAVCPRLVGMPPPCGDHGSCMLEVVEVVIVEALIAKFAVEALDVGVLRRSAAALSLRSTRQS